jgi:hypothetical protein
LTGSNVEPIIPAPRLSCSVLRSAAFFADLYASTYPDGIQGMVLLDAAFPDEPEFDSLWPAAGQCRVW